jgi:hypothetical protein
MTRGEYIGRFVNRWRQRNVAIYEHPNNAELIITVGTPFDGGKVIECEEKKKDYAATLRRIELATEMGKVHIYE